MNSGTVRTLRIVVRNALSIALLGMLAVVISQAL